MVDFGTHQWWPNRDTAQDSGDIKEDHESPQHVQSVSRPYFEKSTSRAQVQRVERAVTTGLVSKWIRCNEWRNTVSFHVRQLRERTWDGKSTVHQLYVDLKEG